MRLRPDPAPDRRFLSEAPLHVVVLTYPETLPVLRDAGVDVAARGGRALQASDDAPEELFDRLLDATGWRPSAGEA